MAGGIVIVIVMLLVIPVGVMLGGAVWSALLMYRSAPKTSANATTGG